VAAVKFVEVTDITVSPRLVAFVRVISSDSRAGCCCEMRVPILVALAVLVIVRTSARIVETSLDLVVIISANMCASARSFVARIGIACAVSVVRSSTFRCFVIAITITVQSTLTVATVSGVSISMRITLPVNAVCAAVVLVVVAETVLVVTSNVVASVAG